MKSMKRGLAARGALCAMVMVLTTAVGSARADVVEDITASAPRIAKVAFENEYVRGIEFTLRPGQTLPTHEGQPRAVYSLSDYRILWTEGDAAPAERTWKKGDVHWHDAVPHAVENIGTTTAKYLVVTRRNTPLPSSEPYRLTDDAASVDPRRATVIFENEHMRVTDVRIPVGERQPVHDGGHRLIYSLSAYTIKVESDQHGTRATRWKPGMAHWHEPDEHAVENAGNHFVHFVIFAFKR